MVLYSPASVSPENLMILVHLQIIVLAAEILVGLVTARQGFNLLRRLNPKDPVKLASQQAKDLEALLKADKVRSWLDRA